MIIRSVSDLTKLNERYSMFSCITDDPIDDAEFLFSAKDDLTSKDMETKCGSKILEGYRPLFDATAIEKMRNAGGKLIGKTNLDEFGFGTFCTNSAFGIPKNPFDPERSCGGSSGGSACAAAVIDDHISLGVSTGGSISCPASFCGVYGLSTTYGRVSRHGVIDCGSSFDRMGLLSSDPKLLSKYLPVIAGKDDLDPPSYAQPVLELNGKKIRSVAVPKGIAEDISEDVRQAFGSSIETLKSMGIEVSEIDIGAAEYAMPAYHAILSSEVSTNLSRYGGMRYGQQDGDLSLKFDDYFTYFRTQYLGEETKKRILLGTYTRMEGVRDRYYVKALKFRQYMIAAYKSILSDHDAILTPTMPFVSPKFADISNMSLIDTYDADRLNIPSSLCGMPSISVPCGYNDDGMPIGMQLVTDHWQEDLLLSFAKEWDSAFDIKHPEVSI